MTVALASAIGLVLSSLAAYVIEALDDSLKSTEEINRLIKAPILGNIQKIPEKNKMSYVVEEPRAPVSDAFRMLRTNLEFLGIKNPLQVILVTSQYLTVNLGYEGTAKIDPGKPLRNGRVILFSELPS